MRSLIRLFCCLLMAVCFGIFSYSGLVVLAQGPAIGTIVMYAGSTPPDGYLMCDGQAISRVYYADLYNVITTTYGVGDSSTTFNLPSFNMRVPLGSTDMCNPGELCPGEGGVPEEIPAFPMGLYGGEFSHTLTIDEIPSHYHNIGLLSNRYNFGGSASDVGGNTNYESGYKTDVTGGGGTHNTMQPYLAVSFIIAYTTSQITPTPTPTTTATPTPTSTATPYISSYTHTLTSGKTLVAPVYATFGDLLISSAILSVIAIVVLGLVFRIVYRQ